jgi:hypothetical protein
MSINAPVDLKTVQDTIHQWMVDTTDLFCIWGNQSEHQPEMPFGILQIISGPRALAPQWDMRSKMIDDQIEFVIYVPCLLVVSCQAFVSREFLADPTKNALSYLCKIQSSLSLPSVKYKFFEKNIAYVRASEVRNLDFIQSDAHISRAGIDVTFGLSLELSEVETSIGSVEIESESLDIDQIITGG